jgi:2-iminoacetate synthase ThiH
MGANDLGSIMIEENVITPAGASHRATEADLRDAIMREGFVPCKRNAGYRRLEERKRDHSHRRGHGLDFSLEEGPR